MRFLIIFLLVTSCTNHSTPYVESADPCARPVQIPPGWVSDRQIELLWGQDRKALLDCRDKVETLSGRKPNS